VFASVSTKHIYKIGKGCMGCTFRAEIFQQLHAPEEKVRGRKSWGMKMGKSSQLQTPPEINDADAIATAVTRTATYRWNRVSLFKSMEKLLGLGPWSRLDVR